jgi:hypothetical protein
MPEPHDDRVQRRFVIDAPNWLWCRRQLAWYRPAAGTPASTCSPTRVQNRHKTRSGSQCSSVNRVVKEGR